MTDYLIFFVGFGLLLKGADWLVDGSSSIAKRFGISRLVIGLTIVSFGTSAPELLVNIIASFQGSSELAIGNIVGSNIANILLILGMSAIIFPLKLAPNTTWKEIPLSLLAIVVFGLLVNDQIVDGSAVSILSRIDGFVLLAFFIIFIYYTFGIGKVQGEDEDFEVHKGWSAAIMIIGGIVGLGLGGKWVVDGGTAIAQQLGLSEAFIGLSLIALGTSLPELATSAVAAYRKKPDIAVGNIVGSNIFNIFWILGLSAVIQPLEFNTAMNTDLMFLLLATVLLLIFMFVGKRHMMERWQGISFIGLYGGYIAFLIYRG
ncbi:MAG: calcium/sodium antiporter [bacterium]|nr:calcium/sodium antiporter [bacterium]